MVEFVEKILNKIIEILEPIPKRWVVFAKRCVVEGTVAWLNHYPRLCKDYKISVAAAENRVMIAHSMLLLRWIAYP